MKKNPFLRELTLWDAVAIVVGCIIGAGVFRVPSPIAHHLETPAVILGVWLAGGLLSMAGALCYAELSSMFPKTGGDYVYLREAYGHAVSFLFGWTKLFVERTGTIAIIAYVFAEYVGYLADFSKGSVKFLALAAIALLTAANVAGVKYGKHIQNIFTSLKVLALVFIIGLGLFFLPERAQAGLPSFMSPPVTPGWALIQSAGMALIFVLWTYGGWTEAAYVAEEVLEPARNVPRAIIGGLAFVTAIYLAVNCIYYLYIPASAMKETKLVASVMVSNILGPWGGKLVALFVAASTFGALNGYILTGGRILYALSEDHALFHRLAAVHPKFHTPYLALIFNGSVAALLIMTKTFDQLMEYTTVAISLFFALTGLSVIVLRRKFPERERPYRVLGYPLVPLLFAASTLLFIVNAVVQEPRECLFGLALVGLGGILYLVSRKLDKKSHRSALEKMPSNV
ncbi:MAG: amino acid permease [Candidatus Omnitrophica bacterium]|nr:amino acid permease [Candidatus Omnitrophota bacterium]